MKRIKKKTRPIEKAVTPEYLAQLIEAYNYYFYHYDETPLLVVDTNEIDFVNRPADFDDLVAQIQKAQKGVQYYVPAGSRSSAARRCHPAESARPGRLAVPRRADIIPPSP